MIPTAPAAGRARGAMFTSTRTCFGTWKKVETSICWHAKAWKQATDSFSTKTCRISKRMSLSLDAKAVNMPWCYRDGTDLSDSKDGGVPSKHQHSNFLRLRDRAV
jgi:hypothetical protein